MKKVIRLTEGDLHRIIENSVQRILAEAKEEQLENTPEIHCYCPGSDVYIDVNNTDGIHEYGAYLAMVSEYDKDILKRGCHVKYYPWLTEHPKQYKELIQKLKNIERDESYRLSPRSKVEWDELQERGISWENGHYYKEGKALN